MIGWIAESAKVLDASKNFAASNVHQKLRRNCAFLGLAAGKRSTQKEGWLGNAANSNNSIFSSNRSPSFVLSTSPHSFFVCVLWVQSD